MKKKSFLHKIPFLKKLFSTNQIESEPKKQPPYSLVPKYRQDYRQLFYDNPNLYIETAHGWVIQNLRVYSEIEKRDYQFRTLFEQRDSRIKALDIVFIPARAKEGAYKTQKTKRVNDYIIRQLEKIAGYNHETGKLDGFDYFVNYCLTADRVGKAILNTTYKTINEFGYIIEDNMLYEETIFDMSTGYYEVDDIILCEPEYFDFRTIDNALCFVKDSYNYVECDKYQFIVHTNKGTELNPHGQSDIGEAGYELFKATKYLYQDYLNSAGRHGDPPIDATVLTQKTATGEEYEPDNEQLSYALNLASDISNGKSFAHSSSIDISFMKDENGTFDFESAIELIDRAKTKLILHSTTTIQNSESTGSMALGQVHENSLSALIDCKAKDIQGTINDWIHRLLDLNGLLDDGIYSPHVIINYQESIDVEKLSSALELVDRGIPIKLIDIYKSASFEVPDGFDPNLTTVGYPKLVGKGRYEYVKGMKDINEELYNQTIDNMNNLVEENNEQEEEENNEQSNI